MPWARELQDFVVRDNESLAVAFGLGVLEFELLMFLAGLARLYGTVLFVALRGKLPAEKALNLEIAALYWHFVDVVWIVIFPVVYLMR